MHRQLTNYVAWLINWYPTKSEQLTACLRTLKIKDIVYETLDTIDNVLWESWKVSDDGTVSSTQMGTCQG